MLEDELREIKKQLFGEHKPKRETAKSNTEDNRSKKSGKKRLQARKRKNVSRKKQYRAIEPLNLIGRTSDSKPKDIDDKSKSNRQYNLNVSELIAKPKEHQVFQSFSNEDVINLNWCRTPPKKEGERINLFIGLDFGTAFTKVVIGAAPYHYVLDFGTVNGLQPSELWVGENGECALNQKKGFVSVSDLKLPFLKRIAKITDTAAATAFIALILKECRTWLDSSPYKLNVATWFINCGLPTESYEDDYLQKAYLDIIKKAWNLSFVDDINLKSAHSLLKNQISIDEIPSFAAIENEQINLFPEFIAQITGYVNSPKRRKYSHLLIDVGAGTLDVALFTVANDFGDWVFRVHSRRIEILGADILKRHRSNCANKSSDEVSDLISTDQEIMARTLNITLEELEAIDDCLSCEVNKVLLDVIGALGDRNKIEENIITFLCGGGRELMPYKEALSPIIRDFKIEKIDIPEPDNIQQSKDVEYDFHRISVAYGLSNDPFNIGKTIKMQLEPVEGPIKRSDSLQTEIIHNRINFYKS